MHGAVTMLSGKPRPDRRRSGLPDELDPGTPIGPWIVEGELGKGGMSTVYAVRHREFGKRAAVKLANRDVFGPRFTADRFLLEARVVNTVDHPDVVDIFDTGVIEDRPYLVMERLSGETLGDRLERGPLSHDEISRILIPLCEILRSSHDAGVVHRDLKLDNVFLANVRGGTRVKLLDWGLANLAGEDPMADMIAGTPHYVAPEQVRGEAVTPRSDIYSLGVLAYVLYLGRAPFDHESSAEILKQHVKLLPPPPKARWADIPPALEATILGMLAKDPFERPALGEIARVVRTPRPAGTPPPVPRRLRTTRPTVTARPPAPPPRDEAGYVEVEDYVSLDVRHDPTIPLVPADVLGRAAVFPTLEKRWWIGAAVAACLVIGALAWRATTGGRIAQAAPARAVPAVAPSAAPDGAGGVALPTPTSPFARAREILGSDEPSCPLLEPACPARAPTGP
jgi:serine/threonine protein kinase